MLLFDSAAGARRPAFGSSSLMMSFKQYPYLASRARSFVSTSISCFRIASPFRASSAWSCSARGQDIPQSIGRSFLVACDPLSIFNTADIGHQKKRPPDVSRWQFTSQVQSSSLMQTTLGCVMSSYANRTPSRPKLPYLKPPKGMASKR
ncbi:hypothetical protein D3C76_368100 [compost metagenome]